jgi:hypothetical protein
VFQRSAFILYAVYIVACRHEYYMFQLIHLHIFKAKPRHPQEQLTHTLSATKIRFLLKKFLF